MGSVEERQNLIFRWGPLTAATILDEGTILAYFVLYKGGMFLIRRNMNDDELRSYKERFIRSGMAVEIVDSLSRFLAFVEQYDKISPLFQAGVRMWRNCVDFPEREATEQGPTWLHEPIDEETDDSLDGEG